MKALIIASVALVSVSVFGQSLEETGTLHRWDYLDILMAALSTIGGGAVFAAWVPKKVQKAVPLLATVLRLVGQNVREAANKDD